MESNVDALTKALELDRDGDWDCMVAVDDSFELKDEFLLITDPIHLGQTMNATSELWANKSLWAASGKSA